MDAPAAVLALVLAETLVGGLALLWLAPTWGAVRHGYEMLLGATLAVIGWGAWAAARGPLTVVAAAQPSVEATADLAATGLLVTSVLVTAAVVSLAVRLPPLLARLVGVAATLAGLATIVALAALRADITGQGLALGVAELVLGALLLGAIWDGMVLGHWYLVERRLDNRYMIWMAWTNVVAVAAGVVAVLLSARNPVPCAGLSEQAARRCVSTFSPILTIEGMTTFIGLGVLALVAIIAGFNVKLAREGGRSIQASTGMFYLAVILAPAAEFAAKVRYF